MKSGIFLALALTLPGAAPAASTAAATAPVKPAAATAGKPVPLPLTPGPRRVTLSPEGNVIAARIMGSPDPRMAQIRTELTTIKQDQLKLIAGPTVDLDKLEPLFRREEALQTEARTRQNDRMIALLRALTDPDRMAVLQTIANPPQLQNSKPAAAAAATGR